MPIVRPSAHPRFQRGGALAEGGSMYIEREVDDELVAALERSDYCLVFAPRQVGKSSLRVRAAQRLRARGVETAYVDLSAVGAEAEISDWYFSVTREIAVSLDLHREVTPFWDALGEHETPASSLRRFMHEVVLERIDAPVVVFIDEADVTLSLPFSRDDFFAAIRAMFNERAEDPRWARLSFCLIGVMTRADLVEDPDRTPFNIECAQLQLRDLSRGELDGFRPGLIELERDGVDLDALLGAVHHWTAGHPALSQRLCWTLVDRHGERARGDDEEGVAGHERAAVDACVRELFLERGRELDPVLNDTSRRFSRARRDRNLARDIELYERLLSGAKVSSDGRNLGPGGIALLARLRVAGLVGETEDGHLRVRSRIVAQVFDLAWARSIVDERLLSDDLHLWLDGGRDPADLLRGARLARALEWMEGRTDVTDHERDFVFESESDEARRRRVAFLGMLVIVVSLVGMLIFAVLQYGIADDARERAEDLAEDARAAQRAATEAARLAARAARNERGYRASLLAGVGGAELESLVIAIEASEPIEAPPVISSWPATGLEPYYDTRSEAERDALARPSSAVAQGLVDALIHARTLRTIQTSPGEAPKIAVSPDGRYVAVASYIDGNAGVYEVATGARVIEVVQKGNYRGGYSDLHFSPNGALLATVDHGVANLWSVASGELATTIDTSHTTQTGLYPQQLDFNAAGDKLVTNTGLIAAADNGKPLDRLVGLKDNALRTAAWSSAADQIAGVDAGGQVLLWPEEGRRPTPLSKVSQQTLLAWSPDGSRLGVVDDTSVQLWDPQGPSDRPLYELVGHQALVLAMRFSPDGETLATADGNGALWLWDPATGKALAQFESRSGSIETLAWSPDGDLVATGGEDPSVRLWAASSPEPVVVLVGHRGSIGQLEFTPNGETLISAAMDGSVRLWGMRTGLPRAQLYDAEVEHAVFGPRGQVLVTGEPDAIRLWNVEGGDFLRELEGSAGVANGVLTTAQAPSGPRVAAVEGQVLGLWDASSGERLETFDGECGQLWSARFSPDGTLLAAGCSNGRAVVWDVEKGDLVSRSDPPRAGEDHNLELWTLRFVENSSRLTRSELRLAGGNAGGQVNLWNPRGGELIGALGRHTDAVLAIAPSPDGTRIASASADGGVRVWGLESREQLRRIDAASGGELIDLCYADDARRLVTAGAKDVVLWSTERGERIQSISNHNRRITALACAPQGDLIASASVDGLVELWDPILAQRIVLFDALAPIDDLRYSPTGEHLLVVTDDGLASTWTVRPEDWISDGCELLRHSTSDGQAMALEGYAAELCNGQARAIIEIVQSHRSPDDESAQAPTPAQYRAGSLPGR